MSQKSGGNAPAAWLNGAAFSADVFREGQNDLEQISVGDDLKDSAAQFGIAFGDGQTKTVSIGASGFVSANESLGDLLHVKEESYP